MKPWMSRETVVRFDGAWWWRTFALGLIGYVVGLLIAAAQGCAGPQVTCTSYYGRDMTRANPYYLAVECPGDVTKVVCDSPKRLPQPGCGLPE